MSPNPPDEVLSNFTVEVEETTRAVGDLTLGMSSLDNEFRQVEGFVVAHPDFVGLAPVQETSKAVVQLERDLRALESRMRRGARGVEVLERGGSGSTAVAGPSAPPPSPPSPPSPPPEVRLTRDLLQVLDIPYPEMTPEQQEQFRFFDRRTRRQYRDRTEPERVVERNERDARLVENNPLSSERIERNFYLLENEGYSSLENLRGRQAVWIRRLQLAFEEITEQTDVDFTLADAPGEVIRSLSNSLLGIIRI